MSLHVDYAKLFGSVLTLEIQAASSKHPNSMKFSGVLVRVDEPSTKAPQGSNGHKILIPKDVAAAQLKTLIGMPVNYHQDLDKHAPGHAVGVIKAAKIVGKDVVISGVIWKKNFPDAQKHLSCDKLGMSFEASEISVEDKDAHVWRLSGLCFTGATILYKDAAAYYRTSAKAIAAAASPSTIDAPLTLVKHSKRKGAIMATTNDTKLAAKKKLKAARIKAQAEQESLVAALAAAMAPVVAGLNNVSTKLDALQASMETSEGNVGAAGEDDDEEDMKSKGKPAKKAAKKSDDDDEDEDEDDDDDDEDDDDLESGADDEDEIDDLEEGDHDDDMVPGKLDPKKNVISKDKAIPVKPAGKKGKVSASADVSSLIDRQARQIAKLRKMVSSQQEAISAAASNTERRSISCSAALTSTLAKGNLDAAALIADDQKVTLKELDNMIAAASLFGPAAMAVKTEAARKGLLVE